MQNSEPCKKSFEGELVAMHSFYCIANQLPARPNASDLFVPLSPDRRALNLHGNAPKSWESKFPELTNHAMFIIRLAHNSLAAVTQESHQTSLTIKSLVNLKSFLRWMAGRPGKTSF